LKSSNRHADGDDFDMNNQLFHTKTFVSLLTTITCSAGFAQTSPEVLPAVMVTATRTDHATDETPGASFVVTSEQMDARNLLSIDEAVDTIPGVFNRRGKGVMDTLSAITLRGMPDQKRTLVLLDGMPMNDGYTGAVNYGGLSVDDYRRVEVALGAGSSLYGSNAMGGVVNLVTQMPEKRELNFRAGYGNGLGSSHAMHDFERGYVSYGDKFENGLSIFTSIGAAQTDGYATDLNVTSSKPTTGLTGWSETTSNTGSARYLIGARGDNHWDDNQGTIRAALDLPERGQLRVSYQRSGYQYSYGQPTTYLRDSSGNPVWGYGSVREASFLGGSGETTRDLYQVMLETALGSGRLKVNVGVSDTGTNWYTTPGSTASTTRSGGPGTVSSTPSQLNYADAQYTISPTTNQVLMFGTSLRVEKADTTEKSLSDWRDEDSTGATTYRAGGKSNTIGMFVQDEVVLTDKLTGTAGLRLDSWQTSDGYANSTTYDDRSDTALSPKMGFVYRLSQETTLRTSLGRAFRAPTIYELYRTWTSSSGTTYRSNPDLTPETATTWDIGGDFRPWQGGELKATFYINRIHDMIYRRTISSTLQEYVNAGKASGKGIELGFRQKLPSNWAMLAGATINHTRILENDASPSSVGKQFTFVPEKTASLGAEWSQGPWNFSGTVKYVSKRYQNDANTDVVSGVYTSYDAYTTVDLKAGYHINKNLKLALSIDNALNRDYYSYYQAPGRSYFIELSGHY